MNTTKGTKKTTLSECEIGDFVKVGEAIDEPAGAEAAPALHLPLTRPSRTLGSELSRGIAYAVIREPEQFFERKRWHDVATNNTFDVWKRVS